ncbi:hypothetical protein Patl1_30452 [Pistacia atlantica]|uniref:Uncharacterized protein n=1 Tax=Pistacia atlantica TaxID=434234 RepID=A0ACC1A862_9ROSI|nr:hypothetical protein Patl1_30452 [Pistacia atlantica]
MENPFSSLTVKATSGSPHSSESPTVTITRSHITNVVEIEVGNFFIKTKATMVPITQKDSQVHNHGITQENCFAHLDLNFKFYALSGDVMTFWAKVMQVIT